MKKSFQSAVSHKIPMAFWYASAFERHPFLYFELRLDSSGAAHRIILMILAFRRQKTPWGIKG